MTVHIQSFFEPETATLTHVVSDPKTATAVVIDSVLNYDPTSGHSHTTSADEVIAYIKKNNLRLEWILETHIHADHLTAAQYIKEKLGGKIGIGAHIQEVLATWVPLFNIAADTPLDGSQFDALFADNTVFKFGSVDITVWHTPGHTPSCSCYLIEDTIFVGDTLFFPDVGTARTDFPGGSAITQYDSIQRILSLPDMTRVFICHDYPPASRTPAYSTTVQVEKEKNILINSTVSKETYVTNRQQRDTGKAVPKLLLPAIQFNLRAGHFGHPENNGVQYIKIPVNTI